MTEARSLAAILQTALQRVVQKHKLTARGYTPPSRPLRATPATAAQGPSDVGAEHDRYLAESLSADAPKRSSEP